MIPAIPNSAQMEQKPKRVFHLDTPFTTIQWPQLLPENQDTILELLCNLLSPLGQHRASHTTVSKGKRNKKRKRQEAKLGKEIGDSMVEIPLPVPEISHFVSIGLNSITRILESSSHRSRPNSLASNDTDSGNAAGFNVRTSSEVEIPDIMEQHVTHKDSHPTFSAIFVSRHSQPSILHDHLPQLLATASLGHPESPAIRLVQLPKGSEERLCEALRLPRVSHIGLFEGAPHSKSLIDLIRDCVSTIEIPWMKATEAKYLPVKINSTETFNFGVKKKST